jgi:hypothetical protein
MSLFRSATKAQPDHGRPQAKLIAENDAIRLVWFDAGSDTTLITFNPLRPKAEGEDFWGSPFAYQAGLSTLGVLPLQPHWYPKDAMMPLVEKALPWLRRAGHLVAYGYSMGGHGALKYAAAFGADAALAFSPQWTIDPKKTKDRRYETLFVDRLKGMEIAESDLGGKALVFADLHTRPDLSEARRIRQFAPSRVAIARLPRASHSTIGHMLDRTVAVSVIEATRLPLPRAKRTALAAMRAGRKRLPIYYVALARAAFSSGRQDAAMRILDVGLSRVGHNSLLIQKARWLARNDPNAAIQMAKKLSSSSEDRAAEILLAQLYFKTGEIDIALRHLDAAKKGTWTPLPRDLANLETLRNSL